MNAFTIVLTKYKKKGKKHIYIYAYDLRRMLIYTQTLSKLFPAIARKKIKMY